MTIARLLLGAAFLGAGVLKFAFGGDFRLMYLMEVGSSDPAWLFPLIALLEVIVGVMLLRGGRLVKPALVGSVVLSTAFCFYHVGLGMGLGAPT